MNEMANQISKETMDLYKAAFGRPDADLLKAWVQSGSAVSGITAYDLEAPAKLLFPVLTPLRNMIPRVAGKGGIQANWRAVTGINVNNQSLGVSEGNRGGVTATTVKDYLAVYVELGLEDSVTWKAQYAAQGFDDVLALATDNLLKSTMIGEEQLILAGQGTFGLGLTPQPSCTPIATLGSLTNAASPYTVYCVALNYWGYKRSTLRNLVQDITRTNADGSSDTFGGGSAQVSLGQPATIPGGGVTAGSITATVAAVPGAVAYAWFWGPNAGAVKLGAITTVNQVVITALASGTVDLSTLDTTLDHSANSLEFDGFFAQIAKTGSGSYMRSLDGAVLTSGKDGSIVEFDDALQSFWDNYRLSPTSIWVGSQEDRNIRSKIMNSASLTGAMRFVFNAVQGQIVGGSMAVSYLNPFAMSGDAKAIPINLHPNIPNGTVMFLTDVLPYPMSNVTNVFQMLLRQDYFAITWPMVKRKREYGVYLDGVLQHYFPPSMGTISNIGNG